MNTTPMPCDRGVPGNLNRGWHHFQCGPLGTCCVYCGAHPNLDVQVTLDSSSKEPTR